VLSLRQIQIRSHNLQLTTVTSDRLCDSSKATSINQINEQQIVFSDLHLVTSRPIANKLLIGNLRSRYATKLQSSALRRSALSKQSTTRGRAKS
jgi:hypothetical protein